MSSNKSLSFFIAPLQQIDVEKNAFLRKKSHTEVELILVTSDYVIVQNDSNFIRVNSGDIHLAFSSKMRSFSEKGTSLSGWCCSFSPSFLGLINVDENMERELELIASFLHHYPLRLNKASLFRLSSNFEIMGQLSQNVPTNYSLIRIYLLACIYEMKQVMTDSHLDFYPAKAFSIVQKYNDLLNVYLTKEHTIEFYAKMLKISPNHLNKSVKSVTGKTAISLLNEMRITEAKNLLKETDLSIAEIAFQLGFEDQSYFSRFFRKNTGDTPKAFRG